MSIRGSTWRGIFGYNSIKEKDLLFLNECAERIDMLAIHSAIPTIAARRMVRPTVHALPSTARAASAAG